MLDGGPLARAGAARDAKVPMSFPFLDGVLINDMLLAFARGAKDFPTPTV